MIATDAAGSDALGKPRAVTEFLICGASAASVTPRLEALGLTVFDASGIHARIADASGAASDLRRLRVPIVPASVWTRLTQVVSRERSASRRWAVAADDLALFIPVWKHLMPAAHIVSLASDPGTEEGNAQAAFQEHYVASCSFPAPIESADDADGAETLAQLVEGLL